MTALNTRELADRARRRKRVGRRGIAQAVGGYYRCRASGHGRYRARCGPDGPEVVTSVLTCPVLSWLDLGCALTANHDRLRLAGSAADGDVPLDGEAASAAVQRLAEILAGGTRFADMPLYRLTGIDAGKGEINGSLGITPFAHYALTLDLLEGELCDALAAGVPAVPGSLPLRDRYLPDLRVTRGAKPRPCGHRARPVVSEERPARRWRARGLSGYDDTNSLEDLLWSALRDAPEHGADVAGLMRATGMGRSTVYRYLAQLAEQGHAEQVGWGRWRATTPGHDDE
jgi:hypothetical protein